MNSVQLHLALTHVPVILLLVGLAMLIVAFLKNSILTKASYVLLFIAGLMAIPVFFSGEGAEEAIEKLPGISESVIEKHEDVAKLGMVSIAVVGLLAIAAFYLDRWQKASRVFKTVVLIFAIVSGGLMIQTAHLGGEIRHTEIRKGLAAQDGTEAASKNVSQGNQPRELNED